MIEMLNTFRKEYGLRILIILLSILFLCTYISRKEGFHMDEILSFQLANAEYNPWILPTEPERRLARFMAEHIEGENVGETIANIGFIIKDTWNNRGNSILADYKAKVYEAPVWITRDMFRDYVQCDRDDDYNFVSVYYNAMDDNHPPLYFMLVHFMSSLFKGDISIWKGCFINLLAVAGTLWLLGLIGDIIFKRKGSTVALMLLYGFSMGAVGTVLWVRMYGILSLWTVWLLYLHLRKYADTDETKRKGSLGILIMTILSFWTQYFGLFFILPLAAVTVILLAKDKRTRELWAYIRTMITAAIIGICVYPFAISDVLFSQRGTEALGQWKNGIAEFIERITTFGDILGRNVVGSGWLLVLVILVPAVLIAGKLQKHNKRITAVADSSALENDKIEASVSTTGEKQIIAWRQFILFGVPAVVYFLLAAKMSPYYVDRYIMAIFPVTSILIVWLWDCLCGLFQKHGGAWKDCTIVAVVLLLIVCQNLRMNGEHEYLYTGYQDQLAIADAYAEYPCVCLYPGLSFYENVMEMECYAQTILVKSEELGAMDEERVAITQEGYIALIKYPGEENGKDQLMQVMQVFGGSEAELLYQGGAHGDIIYLVTP